MTFDIEIVNEKDLSDCKHFTEGDFKNEIIPQFKINTYASKY
jgi:hypothetical protein